MGSAATRASGRMGRRERKVRVFMGRWETKSRESAVGASCLAVAVEAGGHGVEAVVEGEAEFGPVFLHLFEAAFDEE